MQQESSADASTTACLAGVMDLQRRTFLLFCATFSTLGLCSRKLMLCADAGPASCAAALAVTVLGGACLTVGDATKLRSAGRLGATDFTVTGLTEALRIVKNELRQTSAVSVGLAGEPVLLVREMLHRGVQPDLVLPGASQLLRPFLSHGATELPVTLPQELSHLGVVTDTAVDMTERRRNDVVLVKVCSGEAASDVVRAIHARWFAIAPRIFPRDRHRVYLGTRTTE